MDLREQGFRFCVSPDRKSAKWVNPVQQAKDATYSGWIDVTDWPEADYAKWLMEGI